MTTRIKDFPQEVPPMRPRLTVSEVAAHLNISRGSVYSLFKRGLPYTKVGDFKRVYLDTLEWWIAQQECSSDPEAQAYIQTKQTEWARPGLALVTNEDQENKSAKPKRRISTVR